MKLVQVDENKLHVILENDRFIDIYTFEEIDGQWGYNIFTDNGKGWKLYFLNRHDRKTNRDYFVSSEPGTFSLSPVFDYEIKYEKDGIEYDRQLIVNYQYVDDKVGYITQDIRRKTITREAPKEMIDLYRKQFGSGIININSNGEYIDVDNGELLTIKRNDVLEGKEWFDPETRPYIYLFNDENDYDETNSILRDFYNFQNKYFVFGRPGEKPRLVELVGEDEATYYLRPYNYLTGKEAKVVCNNPNKYKYVKDVKRWHI